MDRICMLINTQGFYIQKMYRPRELGVLSLTTGEVGSYRFDLRGFEPSIEDRIGIRFVQNYVHGLSLCPLSDEMGVFKPDDLTTLIENMYYTSKRNYQNVVAFKGGHHERDILEKMNIPYVNLEIYGYPKCKPTKQSCGYHVETDNCQCAVWKCRAFRNWIEKNR